MPAVCLLAPFPVSVSPLPFLPPLPPHLFRAGGAAAVCSPPGSALSRSRAAGHARERAALGRELGWAGFPFAFHRRARGVWLMSAADKGDERIIKRPQSPFISPPLPAANAVCLLRAPLRGGAGRTRALAEVVVCAVGRVVTLPAVEITAQATALLVLVMISCR